MPASRTSAAALRSSPSFGGGAPGVPACSTARTESIG